MKGSKICLHDQSSQPEVYCVEQPVDVLLQLHQTHRIFRYRGIDHPFNLKFKLKIDSKKVRKRAKQRYWHLTIDDATEVTTGMSITG